MRLIAIPAVATRRPAGSVGGAALTEKCTDGCNAPCRVERQHVVAHCPGLQMHGLRRQEGHVKRLLKLVANEAAFAAQQQQLARVGGCVMGEVLREAVRMIEDRLEHV